jgi:polygalacturonase
MILAMFVGRSTLFAVQYPANSGIQNVKDYGAKGDGVTDDTGAINYAIAASTGRL